MRRPALSWVTSAQASKSSQSVCRIRCKSGALPGDGAPRSVHTGDVPTLLRHQQPGGTSLLRRAACRNRPNLKEVIAIKLVAPPANIVSTHRPCSVGRGLIRPTTFQGNLPLSLFPAPSALGQTGAQPAHVGGAKGDSVIFEYALQLAPGAAGPPGNATQRSSETVESDGSASSASSAA